MSKNVENVIKVAEGSLIKSLAYTVRSETTNNYIYIQHYIKLLIRIWP